MVSRAEAACLSGDSKSYRTEVKCARYLWKITCLVVVNQLCLFGLKWPETICNHFGNERTTWIFVETYTCGNIGEKLRELKGGNILPRMSNFPLDKTEGVIVSNTTTSFLCFRKSLAWKISFNYGYADCRHFMRVRYQLIIVLKSFYSVWFLNNSADGKKT